MMSDVICVSDSESEEIRPIPDLSEHQKIDNGDVVMIVAMATPENNRKPSTSSNSINNTNNISSSSSTLIIANDNDNDPLDIDNMSQEHDSMTDLDEFLDEIENAVKNSKYFDIIRQKTPSLKFYYKHYRQQIDAQHLKFLMTVTGAAAAAPSTNTVMSMAENGLLQFTRLFKKLKNFHQPHLLDNNKKRKRKNNDDGISNNNNKDDETDNGQKKKEEEEEEQGQNDDEIIVEASDVDKLRKIEAAMDTMVRKIRDLETREVNFDIDDTSSSSNSCYVIMDAYQRRLRKLYEVYCRLLRRDPNAGRATYDHLNYRESQWPEINRAINRRFRTCHTFPAYCDVERVVRRTVLKNASRLAACVDVKRESAQCFKTIGAKIKRKRRKELDQNLLEDAMYDVDPAQCDLEWDQKLKAHYRSAQQKIQEIINKNAAAQDLVERNNDDQMTDDGNDSSVSCSSSSSNSDSSSSSNIKSATDGGGVNNDDNDVECGAAPSGGDWLA